jgi:hypothetical protein
MNDTAEQLPVIQDPVILQTQPAKLLEIAVTNGASVEQLGTLMELQDRWDATQARRAYFAAKAKFQSECPTIKKDKKVAFNKTEYSYAPLASIASQIKVPLASAGLTYRWEIHDEGERINVTCLLSHVDGHSEENTMGAYLDDSGAKNLIQQRGSTVQYLQRYTLIGCAGLSSADTDDDGRSTGELNVGTIMRHNDILRECIHSVSAIKKAIFLGDWSTAVEALHELTEDEVRGLWLATTKGGIFTTNERKAMKSDEWGEARKIHFGSKETSNDNT